jgi:hypothetical protein
MKNFTLGGAQVFQFSSQEPEMIAPLKEGVIAGPVY